MQDKFPKYYSATGSEDLWEQKGKETCLLEQNCISTTASQGDFGKCQNPLAWGSWDGHTLLWTDASIPVTIEEDRLHSLPSADEQKTTYLIHM